MRFYILISLLIILVIVICPPGFSENPHHSNSPGGGEIQQESDIQTSSLEQSLSQFVKDHLSTHYDQLFPPRTDISSVKVSDEVVEIHFNGEMENFPLRPETVQAITSMFKPIVASGKSGAQFELFIEDRPLVDYIPPIFKSPRKISSSAPVPEVPPWVRRISGAAPNPSAGLYGRHIVLWGSHGWFYDNRTDLRWEWQRPRMFTIVEDMLPTSFMIPFILPMLDNAGAVTCYARERDFQANEVLIDDADLDSQPDHGTFKATPQSAWIEQEGFGFQNGLAPYPDDLNPHQKGHHRTAKTAADATARAKWTPNIPEKGRYAVYVSYNMDQGRASDAHYIVYHLGGKAEFLVNQQMGGNTWVYLGSFLFPQGQNPNTASVELTNESQKVGATVSADCVKFGGGMGDILRAGRTSGYPRYCEGARYWLQYAGVKPELVYKLGYKGGQDGTDYTEDYVSRAEFANYLKGAPYGPNPDRSFPGLHVPVDLCFGFHTDAGIKDGIVGTLSIYTEKDDEKNLTFPDGKSRLDNNRMLADLIQTQIVGDVRAKYSSTWTRRQLWNRSYSESRRGNMPSSLLELFSHQNFHDMKYGLDPRVRFDISRAIYKAFLRFIAYKNGYEPIVQPLSPTHLCIIRKSDTSALIKWRPRPDPLEPSADPDGYIVYTRKGGDESQSDFDHGKLVRTTEYLATKLDPKETYSFRVKAFNAGGESFPSEVLCLKTGADISDKPRILIVNAFDRIAPPSMIQKEDYSGFDRKDKGVGYMANYGLTGDQWDFDPSSKFRTNDAPGHGASHGDLETKIELGNTFDFAIRHGAAMADAGYRFDSCSDEAVRDGLVNLDNYDIVDWLLGEERTTLPPTGFGEEGQPDKMKPEFMAFPAKDQELISAYLDQGGKIFISGAYVATDLGGNPRATGSDTKFLEETLKIYWTTNHGSHTNDVFASPEGPFNQLEDFHISSGTGEDGIYGVELPDSLKPAQKPKKAENFQTSETVLRYRDNRWSAGIAMKTPRAVVAFGFPFECITGAEKRTQVMKTLLEHLEKD